LEREASLLLEMTAEEAMVETAILVLRFWLIRVQTFTADKDG